MAERTVLTCSSKARPPPRVIADRTAKIDGKPLRAPG